MSTIRLLALMGFAGVVVAADLGCEGDDTAAGATTGSVANGGAGGGGGASTGVGPAVDPTRLGAACEDRADCGGLPCLLLDPGSDPSGYAGGLCTWPCEDADACDEILTGSRCIDGYCLEPCEVGPSDLVEIDTSKCHGRTDVACFEVLEGGAFRDLCLPTCNADADCGAGMFCEPGRGFCRPFEADGSPDGWPCRSDVECQGVCFGSTPTERGVCARVCTLGHVPSCDWDGSTTASYGCVLTTTPTTSGIGDGGFCGELCDCDGECSNPSYVCAPFADLPHLANPWAAQVVANSGRVGQCVDPKEGVGGSPGTPCGQGGAGGVGGGGGSGGFVAAGGAGGG